MIHFQILLQIRYKKVLHLLGYLSSFVLMLVVSLIVAAREQRGRDAERGRDRQRQAERGRERQRQGERQRGREGKRQHFMGQERPARESRKERLVALNAAPEYVAKRWSLPWCSKPVNA